MNKNKIVNQKSRNYYYNVKLKMEKNIKPDKINLRLMTVNVCPSEREDSSSFVTQVAYH